MNILLDTHIMLWCLYEPEKLSEKAKLIITDPDNWIYYSQLSLWECEIKHNKHPEVFSIDSTDINCECHAAGFSQLELKTRHIHSLGKIGEPGDIKHKDLFDRMLMAQAYADNMVFITHDKRLENYNVKNVVYV